MTFDDPVSDAAPVARRLALRHCAADAEHGGTCAWYHGIWPYFRALGIVTTPAHHLGFYTDALRAMAPDRVLVAGTADYVMPAAVLAAVPGAALTAIDRCATPLKLTEWYARRVGRTVAVAQSVLPDYDDPAPFDAICTHSFLGYFDPTARARLIERFAVLLRPGGQVLTIIRIRPADASPVVGFTADQADAFVARVRAEAGKHALDLAPDRLAQAAAIYTKNFHIHPVTSVDDLHNLFDGAGFEAEIATLGKVADQVDRPPSGPTATGAADYISIKAIKRG